MIISVLVYLLLLITFVGILYIPLIFGVTLFIHGIAIGNIRNNGVRLNKNQFPKIYARAEKIAFDMGIREVPNIYILQSDGILNAFATRFFGKNFIILYSDIVEIAENGFEKELDFIIAHELVHIKRKHITKQMFILPAMWFPLLGNAYSRACEHTCDKLAAAYINNPESSIKALGILAVGKTLVRELNYAEYVGNAKFESGFFTWFSTVLSTHPPLPQRITEVYRIAPMFPSSPIASPERPKASVSQVQA
ncbi:M48 family peptidase [Mesobacillus zeae]|uniref:M48 family peptidase n=1 Tax=Mesobacillus zeae TaxID=1917180 RepID=A0A398AVQ3_9BACI|nr:M48 family peptidase [Mesobacillus zeae]